MYLHSTIMLNIKHGRITAWHLTAKTETIAKGVKEIMSIKILELETDRSFKREWEEGRKEGREEGREEGYGQGELDLLISQVFKKVNREKELSVIIDELESNEDEIRQKMESREAERKMGQCRNNLQRI